MFFILFVLFFLKSFPINSLRCMTNEAGSTLSLSPCIFELNINDPIPDDAKLTVTPSKCAMREANSVTVFSHSDGSCFGEVSIDYNTKKMMVKLAHVNIGNSHMSPYDDMFGTLNGIKSVIQYKINGNLEKEKIEMITRIQCKTYDNCALDKLRKLLPNLIISEPRRNIFKEVIQVLYTPESSAMSQLTCIDDTDNEVQCEQNENRCKYEDLKKASLSKSCATENSDAEYDLEYRFNIIEEMKDSGTDNSADAMKCFYLCNTNNCNSEDSFLKVDGLLNAFAMVSGSDTDSQHTDTNKPSSQTDQKKSNKGKSNGVSFYFRSIIIFIVFIQILSKFNFSRI